MPNEKEAGAVPAPLAMFSRLSGAGLRRPSPRHPGQSTPPVSLRSADRCRRLPRRSARRCRRLPLRSAGRSRRLALRSAGGSRRLPMRFARRCRRMLLRLLHFQRPRGEQPRQSAILYHHLQGLAVMAICRPIVPWPLAKGFEPGDHARSPSGRTSTAPRSSTSRDDRRHCIRPCTCKPPCGRVGRDGAELGSVC
jgi:hypothetical protein